MPNRRATGLFRKSSPHPRAIFSPLRWGGLWDRATGPGDARSGGGAWQASPGPTHNTTAYGLRKGNVLPWKDQAARPPRLRRGRKAQDRARAAGTTAGLPKRNRSEDLQPPSAEDGGFFIEGAMSTRTAAIALLAGIVLAASLLLASPGLQHTSETSAIAAPPQPTATYVSELGPASVRPPRPAVALPASGSGLETTSPPWSKFAGLGLAIAGALLVHAALTLRPRHTVQA